MQKFNNELSKKKTSTVREILHPILIGNRSVEVSFNYIELQFFFPPLNNTCTTNKHIDTRTSTFEPY